MRTKSRTVEILTAAVLLGGALSMNSTEASATGGDCAAYRDCQAVPLAPDNYRVRAICSRLDYETRARGVLDRVGLPFHTQWFTSTGRAYYSQWGNCMGGCSTRVEMAPA